MKKPGWIGVFLIVACTTVFWQSNTAFCDDSAEQESSVKFTLPTPDSEQTRTYLGLDAMKPFKVSDIKAQIVVIELMNSLCQVCQANTPKMNEIYKTIQADSNLADVKVIAIALYDQKPGLEIFREHFKTLFPVLLDEDLDISRSMKGRGIPVTMVVSTRDAKVLITHPGELPDADSFVAQVKFVKQLQMLSKEKQ
jgi:hypothetical protein